HFLVGLMHLTRVGDGFDRELTGSRLLDDAEEGAAGQNGKPTDVQSCQKGRVELLGADFTVSVVGSDDLEFPLDAVGDDERAAGNIRCRLNQLCDVDAVKKDVEDSVFALLTGRKRFYRARPPVAERFSKGWVRKERAHQGEDGLRPGLNW